MRDLGLPGANLATIDSFGRHGNKVDVQDALESPIACQSQQVAWNSSVVGEDIQAPLKTCAPDNLSGVIVGR